MNSNNNIKVTICSDLEHDNLLAEISINGRFIGLVTEEPDKKISFEIPERQQSIESVELDLLEEALRIARSRLIQLDES